MKKLFLLTVFLFSVVVSAQDETNTQNTTSDQGFSFGVKAGVNLASVSNLDEEPGEDISGRTSFHIGALGEYSFNEKFSVQGELLYSELGAEYEWAYSDDYPYANDYPVRVGGDYSYSGEGTVKLSYISVPLLAKYYFIPGLSVEAGPQFSLLLSAKDDRKYTQTNGEVYSESEEEDIKDDLKNHDVGGAIGASYELDFGLFFSVRYVFGFIDISDDINDDLDDYLDSSKNNVFQASAGFKFN